MNEVLKRNLKSGAIVASMFAVVVLVTISIHWFSAPLSEILLKESVAETLHGGGLTDVLPGDAEPIATASEAYSHAWAAMKGKRRTGTIYAVRLTGTAGPWPAVFVTQIDGETFFSGIPGRPDAIVTPVKYGLTPRVIESWVHRLDRFEAMKGEDK